MLDRDRVQGGDVLTARAVRDTAEPCSESHPVEVEPLKGLQVKSLCLENAHAPRSEERGGHPERRRAWVGGFVLSPF